MSVAPALAPPAALPPPASGGPPGAPPGAPPFGSALEHEMARTAQAEGQSRSPGGESRGQGEPRASRGHRGDEGATSLAGTVADATPAQATSAGEGQAPSSGEVAAPGRSNSEQPGVSGTASPATPDPAAVLSPAPASPGASTESESTPAGPVPAQSSESAKGELLENPPAPASASTPAVAPQSADPAARALPAPGERQSSREVSPPSRLTDQAGVGALGKAQREPARDAGEALPADGSVEPGGEGSSGAMPVTRGVTAEATPSPAPPQPAEQAGTGVQAQGPRTAAPAADVSGEQPQSDQRRPDERLVQGVKHATPPSGHDRTTTASSSSSGGSALQTGAPSPAAGGSGPPGAQDAAVAPTAATQPPPTGGANAPQLTARAQLGEMIDVIHATIELAARRGATQARIALQPEELGEIRIHLSQSADGIVARLTAATPAAAQALAAGRGELHQSLSSLGATLLQLDIGTFEGREGRRQVLAGEGSPARRAAGPTEEDDSIAAAEGATSVAAPSSGPRGALVDVLA